LVAGHGGRIACELFLRIPIPAWALLSAKIVKNSKLIVYPNASHGMCTTEKDRVNADILQFLKS
jgi:non-heme chloroperoxidase